MNDEQTEERFIAETGNSQPASFINQIGKGGENGSGNHSLHLI